MAQRKVYTAEFKQQAALLARQPGNSAQGIAADLADPGISHSSLSAWLRAAKAHGPQAFPGQGVPRLTADQEKIKRPMRENEVLRQERSILKAAAVCLGHNGRRLGQNGTYRACPHQPPARWFAREAK